MGRNKKNKPQETIAIIEPKPIPKELPKEEEELLGDSPKEKKLVGYHPVTGEEIWK